MGGAHGQDGRCSSSGKELQEHDALSRKGMHPYREKGNQMSDTPRTAVAKIACGFQAVPDSFLEHAEKLERENAALRAELEMWRDGAIIRKEDHSELLQLRADKKRLDKLATLGKEMWGGKHCVYLGGLSYSHDEGGIRAAIDAARKEQP